AASAGKPSFSESRANTSRCRFLRLSTIEKNGRNFLTPSFLSFTNSFNWSQLFRDNQVGTIGTYTLSATSSTCSVSRDNVGGQSRITRLVSSDKGANRSFSALPSCSCSSLMSKFRKLEWAGIKSRLG